MSQRTKIALFSAGVFLFVVGVAIGFFVSRFIRQTDTSAAYPVREKSEGKYKFIDPLLTFETAESGGTGALASLKSAIEKTIDQRMRNHDIDRASVYVRTLNSGRWINVYPYERYNPASLLKVPTMIAFYKFAESGPDILAKRVTFEGDFNDNNAEHFRPAQTIRPGSTYRIEELIEAMIAYSDNNATRLLHDNINPVLLEKVYNDLGVSLSDSGKTDDFMTVSQYTYFFRVLYNATYLNRTFSESALRLLSRSDFPQGIEAGVATTTAVAHKFGERTIVNSRGIASARELHDCGIVYYPRHPYLLCIMTRGSDFSRLAGVIQDISRLVYEDRDSQYRKQ